jgi:hypothetical protein
MLEHPAFSADLAHGDFLKLNLPQAGIMNMR